MYEVIQLHNNFNFMLLCYHNSIRTSIVVNNPYVLLEIECSSKRKYYTEYTRNGSML